MKFTDVEVVPVSVDTITGTTKAGRPYSFVKMSFIDEDSFDKFSAIVDRTAFDGETIPAWVTAAADEKKKLSVDLSLTPDGYGCKLSITAFQRD